MKSRLTQNLFFFETTSFRDFTCVEYIGKSENMFLLQHTAIFQLNKLLVFETEHLILLLNIIFRIYFIRQNY